MSEFFDTSYLDFNYEFEKGSLIDNLNYLKNLSVEESTLYKKWEECITYKSKYDSSLVTETNIWTPTDIFNKELTIKEINNLYPRMEVVNEGTKFTDWLNLRIFGHTMAYDMAPGRNVKILVSDEYTNKYIGVINLSSDVTNLVVRDKYIGWTDTDKYKNGKLNNTCIASCIMSTQPFGYNFLGGKLIASLVTSKFVRDLWETLYSDILVGITTTSLYGTNSMYNSIPYWKKLGESNGQIYIKPDDEIYKIWHNWIKENKHDDYIKATVRDDGMPVTGIKQKIITLIFKELGIKYSDYVHGFKRGVYFSPMYKNTKEFLTSKIDKADCKINTKYNSYNDIIDWWRNKAIKRYSTLHSENKIKNEILWYNKLPFLTWNETKDKYLKDVGR